MTNGLKILIVEDKAEEAKYLESILLQLQYHVTGIAGTLEAAIDIFQRHQPDICIIDIYLSGKADGAVFAKHVNDLDEKVPFLFLTSNYDNVTFQLAKTTNPCNYLLKPYNPLELRYAIELAMERYDSRKTGGTGVLFIKRSNSISRVHLREIIYIEVEGKYSKIITAREKFLVQQPLKELQFQLPASMFCRIHRNYIVNIEEVAKIDTVTNEATLKNGQLLYCSRRYMDNLMRHAKILK